MRFVPLVRGEDSPDPWKDLRVVELRWTGQLHAGWPRQIRQGLEVHAVHVDGADPALDALGAGLDPDFLVIPVRMPEGRLAQSELLSWLEVLLEATVGRGPRLVLRCLPGETAPLATLLKEAGGNALGFCWHAGIDPDLEAIADRVHCAVAAPGDDLRTLARLGYRWNVAVEAEDPEGFQARKGAFPELPGELLPSSVPGDSGVRPFPLDAGVRLGPAWGARP